LPRGRNIDVYNGPILVYDRAMEPRRHSTGRPAKATISVVIPMYNEEANAAHTLACVKQLLDQAPYDYEIVAVNDGSTDLTLSILDDLSSRDPRVRVVSYWKNGGRGKALRYGFRAARGDYVASIDADLSYDPAYILEMARVLDEDRDTDMVLVSPYMAGGRTEGVPAVRLFVSRLGNKVLQLAMPQRIHTLTCIVRCYRREVLDSLDLESDGKEIHLEILSKALAMGFHVREIPAVLTSRKRGSSKFSFRSTAVSHLIFTVFERPTLLFGLLGVLSVFVGLGIGTYILYLYSYGTLNPNRPLVTLMIIFLLGGIQILSFGFLATQIHFLRKEVLLNRRALAHLKRLSEAQPGRGRRHDPGVEAETAPGGTGPT